jgi:hypothetical protein
MSAVEQDQAGDLAFPGGQPVSEQPGAVQHHPPTVADARAGAGRARVVPGARASGPGGHGQHGQQDPLPDPHVVPG